MARFALTEALVDIAALAARTDSGTFERGRAYYMQARARLRRVEREGADAEVRGSELYQISFWAEDGRLAAICDCPIAGSDPDTVCKHIIAAAMTLKSYLHHNPPQTWESVLASAVKATSRSSLVSVPKQALFFSLQQRRSEWLLFPYSLPLSHFSERQLTEPAELGKTIKLGKLSKQAKPLKSQLDPRRFAAAFGGGADILKLIAASGSYSYYSEKSFEPKSLLPLLAGGFVFRGRENDPLQIPRR